jgi:uncharacterized membrane protein YedE/YeeE
VSLPLLLLLVILGLVGAVFILCVTLTAWDYIQHQRRRARYLSRDPDTYNAGDDWP